MTPREKALNELIKYSNGQKIYSIHPSKLKIDFIPVWYRERMELGIAYLNKRIRKKYISPEITDRLDNLQELMSVGKIKSEEFLVEIMGVEDEVYSKYLCFSDGIHRTITALSTLKTKERYFDETAATPIKELRKRLKEKYNQNPRNKEKKIKRKKNEFGILTINGELAELPPFPKLETEKEKSE